MKNIAKYIVGLLFLLIIIVILIIGKTAGKMAGKKAAEGILSTKKDESVIKDAIRKQLLELSKEINEQTPMMVNEGTRLDTSVVLDMTLTYKQTLVNTSYSDIDKVAFLRNYENYAKQNLCNNENVDLMLTQGVSYDYILYSSEDKYIGEISINKQSCNSE